MRKKTKIAALLSAVGLFTMAASMTAFADTGWVEEGDQWFYYERDGSKAMDTWKMSGGKWYWLDGELDGAMARNKLLVDGDSTYYVDSDGVMVQNDWVEVPNERENDGDDPAEYHYYYMLSNGRAYRSNSGAIRFKTINSRKYVFDDEGRMLYGWIDSQGNRLDGESDWAQSGDMYYCGSWNDGAMSTGWRRINVYDEQEGNDMEHWFYFNNNGKKEHKPEDSEAYLKEKKINGVTYAFDERGVMVYEWSVASGSEADASNWRYFNSPEDGARTTKGWFRTAAPGEENTFGTPSNAAFAGANADDDSEKWYYADGRGELYTSIIKKINNKYYGFSDSGYMLSGLVFMSVDEDGRIAEIYDEEIDSDKLNDFINGVYDDSDGDASLYYFDRESGAMRTDAVSLTVDGENFDFFFSKTGSAGHKGKGVSGIRDNKFIYKFGIKMRADKDNKYAVYYVGDSASVTSNLPGGGVREIKLSDLRSASSLTASANKSGEYISYVETLSNEYFLIDRTGTIIQNKAGAKDGDDWYFYVNKRQIRLYTNNNNLTGVKDDNGVLLTSWRDEIIGA